MSALERHGHLKWEEAIGAKVLAMSAATIDRPLREPKAAKGNKQRLRVVPEIRRRVPIRTFADWNDPEPGSMEMDLVAHCGDVNRGSCVHSLVLTDIASGWTERTPLVVREKTLLTEALEASARQPAVSAAGAGCRQWQRVYQRNLDRILHR